mmetsp:Transcript_29657/g.71783  ORF Transcript_29657/g.71783 Transcript_29657/m.71783 type:complete len:254 (+) Transcript_29657:153-914(+)
MGFAKTYLTLLKTYPLTTNLASGCVLMTVGDGVAQSIENSNSNTTDISSTNNNSNFATNGNKSTILDDKVCSTTTTTTTTYETIRDRIRIALINLGNAAATTQNFNQFTAAQSSSTSSSSTFPDIFLFSNSSTVTSMYTENWDPFRTGTMACWTFFYAPLWVTVYKLYNMYLPKGPTGVVARVALTFATSVPVNAAFYTYGTTVHHTHEWWQELQQQQQQQQLLLFWCCSSTSFVHSSITSISRSYIPLEVLL